MIWALLALFVWTLVLHRRVRKLKREQVATVLQMCAIGEESGSPWLCIVLRQGWKRQVRRMLATVGQPVRRLIRVRIGALTLDNLASGQVRRLSPSEIARALEGSSAPADHCVGRSGRGG